MLGSRKLHERFSLLGSSGSEDEKLARAKMRMSAMGKSMFLLVKVEKLEVWQCWQLLLDILFFLTKN